MSSWIIVSETVLGTSGPRSDGKWARLLAVRGCKVSTTCDGDIPCIMAKNHIERAKTEDSNKSSRTRRLRPQTEIDAVTLSTFLLIFLLLVFLRTEQTRTFFVNRDSLPHTTCRTKRTDGRRWTPRRPRQQGCCKSSDPWNMTSWIGCWGAWR